MPAGSHDAARSSRDLTSFRRREQSVRGSHFPASVESENLIRRSIHQAAGHLRSRFMMRAQHLCLSTFSCVECNCPLVEVLVPAHEAEGHRERQIGLGCLSCGTQYEPLPHLRAVRRIVPFEWGPTDYFDERKTPAPIAA